MKSRLKGWLVFTGLFGLVTFVGIGVGSGIGILIFELLG